MMLLARSSGGSIVEVIRGVRERGEGPSDDIDVQRRNAMYVILGASGHTGSIIADFLLSKGEKVRVLGRDAGRLERFVRKARKRSRPT